MANFPFDANATPVCLDFTKTVIAQYANSPVLLSVLGSYDAAFRACSFFDDFYNNVWNLDTALGFGLDIWGQIVGINRTIKIFNGFFWGYNEETLLLARPYNDITGMFRDFQELSGEITFSDEVYRKLILAKAYYNLSDQSITSINTLLMTLFGHDGHEVYVKDNFDMTISFVFNWLPDTTEAAIMINAGLLSRPAGVRLNIEVNL